MSVGIPLLNYPTTMMLLHESIIFILLISIFLSPSYGDLAYDYSALINYHTTTSSSSSSSPSSSNCYTWYFDARHSSSFSPLLLLPHTSHTARVWVVDPSTASSDELAGTAINPSPSSVQLTRLFSNLGEKPAISFFNHPLMPSSLTANYNSSGSYWYYELTTPSGALIPTSITGRDIHILGCTTQRRRLPLYVSKYTDLASYFTIYHDSTSNTNIPISSPVSPYPYFRTDACAPNIEMLILNSTHLVFTQTAFTQSSQLVSFSDPLLSSFLDVVPMGNGTLVLTSSTAYYLTAFPSSPSLTQSQGLPTTITHISSASNCDYLLNIYGGISFLNYIAFAWNGAAESTFYVSTDDGRTFSTMVVGVSSPSGAGWIVLHVHVSHSYPWYTVVARDAGDGSGSILIYDYKLSSWTTGASLPSVLANAGDKLAVDIPVTGAGTIYMWVDDGAVQDLYYSADGGVTLFPSATLPTPLATSTLISFDTSLFGSYAILASNATNQTLIRELVDIFVYSTTASPASSAVEVDFDPFGDPRVISLSSLGVTSTSTPLVEASSSLPTCPFLHMDTNDTQFHYIDMGESFELAITLVSAATKDAYVATRNLGGSAVSVAISDTSLLDFTLSFLGSSPYTVPITFKHVLLVSEHAATFSSYTERSHLATGSTDVRITAKEYNAQCPFTQFIHKVRVGCPPNRHIIALGPDGDECSSLGGDCAISHYYGDRFKPSLMMYDDDTLTEGKEVDAEYVVWEAYGRTDFSFYTQVRNTECVSNPQKRDDFSSRSLADGTIDFDWSPSTYNSCLIPGGPSVKGGAYQIMSSGSSNTIIFLGGGKYVFRVRVVQTNYSYCDLTADIVVDIYGAPLPLGYATLIVLLTSLVIVVGLFISYYYYRHNEKLHAE